jgi:transcriptional regulator with XRE-family HTH domain
MKAGITQAELASRAGVTVETVARLERVLRGRASANANPSLETMSNLAGALGVDAVDLLERGPAPKGDRIAAMVRLAKPETRRRIAAVVEALLRDEKLQRKAG